MEKTKWNNLVDDSKWYNRMELWVSMFLIVAALVLLTYQVVGRYVFNRSNTWSEEVARYCFVWFTFLGTSYGVLKAGQITIDAFLNLFPKKLRKYIVMIGWLLILFYGVTIAYYGLLYTVDAFRVGHNSINLHLQLGYVFAVIPLAHAFLIVRAIQNIIWRIKNWDCFMNTGETEAEKALREEKENQGLEDAK